MTSQPGLQTIAIHILPNISQPKGNQTMKFGQLIKYNKIKIKNKEARRLVPDLFFSKKKTSYEVKASGLQLRFKIFQ